MHSLENEISKANGEVSRSSISLQESLGEDAEVLDRPYQVVLANALPLGTSVVEVSCPGDGTCAYHSMAFCLTQIQQREGLHTTS